MKYPPTKDDLWLREISMAKNAVYDALGIGPLEPSVGIFDLIKHAEKLNMTYQAELLREFAKAQQYKESD